MKKFLSLVLTLLTCLALTSCGKDEIDLKDDYEISDIHIEIEKGLKEKYGEDYTLGIPVDENFLIDTLGIDMKDVKKFSGRVSDSMVRNDAVIVIKAKDEKAPVIEEAFSKYKDFLIERYTDYPVEGSLERADNALTVTKGNYVIFISAGDFNRETGEPQFSEDVKEASEIIVSLFN